MTITQALAKAVSKLNNKSTSAQLDAEVLLGYLLKQERSWLSSHSNTKLNWKQIWQYYYLINKRSSGYPIAYLLGQKEFYGRKFQINKDVLIPRPETELLVDIALSTIRANSAIRNIVEIGTGSGCIAITLACEIPTLEIIATDISASALNLAQTNAKQLVTINNISFQQGNLLEPIKKNLSNASLLITNLPYLTSAEITGELKHEPRLALDGQADGLKYYHQLINELKFLPPDKKPGFILLELHAPTAYIVANIFKDTWLGTKQIIHNDLANKPRVLEIIY